MLKPFNEKLPYLCQFLLQRKLKKSNKNAEGKKNREKEILFIELINVSSITIDATNYSM